MIDVVKCTVDGKIKDYGMRLGFFDVLCNKYINIKEGGTDDQNRKYASDAQNDILMDPELNCFKDKLHYRNSGFNQVLAALARKNNVAVGFGFSFILNSRGIERARILGRMRQNVRICRKSKTKMVVCSYANDLKEMRGAKDLLAFARVIGMEPGEAKNSLNWKRMEKKVKLINS